MFKASSKFLRLFLPALACLMIGPVQAQNVLENYLIPMPNVKIMPEKELDQKTEFFTSIPFGDKALEYDVRIPKGWTNSTLAPAEETALNTKIIGEIARFYSAPRVIARSYVTLQAINLEYKMSAEHWVLRYLLSKGLTSKGIKKIDDERVEFAYFLVEGDTTYFIHAVAQINGKRVMLFEYFLPGEAWKEEQTLQKAVVESFQIKNPVQEEVEKTVEYRFLDVAKIRYPETWILKAMPIRSIDSMEVQILNFSVQKVGYSGPKTVLDGKIEVFLAYYYSIESLGQEIARIKEKFARTGLILGEPIDSKGDNIESVVKKNKQIELYDLKIFKATNPNNRTLDYELWMTTLEAGDYYYFFTLLTPARTDDFFVWSRNAETYKEIVQSFEPIMDSLIYEE